MRRKRGKDFWQKKITAIDYKGYTIVQTFHRIWKISFPNPNCKISIFKNGEIVLHKMYNENLNESEMKRMVDAYEVI